jgi:hypothetical protein
VKRVLNLPPGTEYDPKEGRIVLDSEALPLLARELRAYLEDELRSVLAQIDAAYWAFTRCKRSGPVPGHLYTRRNELLAALGRKA